MKKTKHEVPAWAHYGMYHTHSGKWTGAFYASRQEALAAERNLGNSYFAIAATGKGR